jgi:hypothetical protein
MFITLSPGKGMDSPVLVFVYAFVSKTNKRKKMLVKNIYLLLSSNIGKFGTSFIKLFYL